MITWLVAIAAFICGAGFGRSTALRQRADGDITGSLPEVLRRHR